MRISLKKCGAAWAGIVVCALVLCVLAGRVDKLAAATSQLRDAHAVASQDARIFAPWMTSRVAIADFDGDLQPDVATVESGSTAASLANYRIRFELSQGTGKSIGVTAAVGGLQIWSQDVNGDSFPDLMVSTKWLHEPVAILLNDGHGNFSVAAPGEFSRTIWSHEVNWESAPGSEQETFAILTVRNTQVAAEDIRKSLQLQISKEILKAVAVRNANVFLFFSGLERAPPA